MPGAFPEPAALHIRPPAARLAGPLRQPVNKRILTVDDDPDLRYLLRRVLERAGYEVSEAASGRECLRAVFAQRPDLVILDVGIPDLDGWQTLERIREISDVPVMMLTARDRELERVRGLRGGADDYLVKPVGNLELQARVEALLRRARPGPEGEELSDYEDAFLAMDARQRQVSVGGRPVPLTPIEYRLLNALIAHRDEVISRDRLVEEVWGGARNSAPAQVKQHMSSLRRKLEEAAGGAVPIETRRGFGYLYRAGPGSHAEAGADS